MKSLQELIQFFVSLHILFSTINATIDDHLYVKSDKFELLDNRQTINVPNRNAVYQSFPPYLAFSVQGATVERIESKSATSWTLKLSDNSDAVFSIIQQDSFTEWQFNWHGGGPNTNREVCIYLGQENVFWYNTYQSMTPSWPMDTNRTTGRRQFNYLFDYQFNRTTDEHLFILEHLFLNTNGFALLMDPNQPLFIRFDSKDTPLMCFSVDNSIPYAEDNFDASYRDIKFNLFTGLDISNVFNFIMYKSKYFKQPLAIQNLYSPLPSWSLTKQVDQNQVIEFANKIKSNGFASFTSVTPGPFAYIKPIRDSNQINEDISYDTAVLSDLVQGEIILDYWEARDGDLQFNTAKFTNPKTMVQTLHQKGFNLGIDIYPILNTKANPEYFIVDRKGHISKFVDFTNTKAAMFYGEQLKSLQQDIGVDTILASPYGMRRFKHVNDTIARNYPGILATRYAETVYSSTAVPQGEGGIIQSQVAFKLQHIPMIVKLFNHYPGQTNEQLLATLIPNALSVSMAGYSNIMTYPIGGYDEEKKPSEELYIRWVQAAALFPRMSFSIPPWEYSENVVKITKKFVQMHYEFMNVLIGRPSSTPLIRPMWYDTPKDPETYKISDQFMIGEYLVGPILKEGQRERLVYLPALPDDISE